MTNDAQARGHARRQDPTAARRSVGVAARRLVARLAAGAGCDGRAGGVGAAIGRAVRSGGDRAGRRGPVARRALCRRASAVERRAPAAGDRGVSTALSRGGANPSAARDLPGWLPPRLRELDAGYATEWGGSGGPDRGARRRLRASAKYRPGRAPNFRVVPHGAEFRPGRGATRNPSLACATVGGRPDGRNDGDRQPAMKRPGGGRRNRAAERFTRNEARGAVTRTGAAAAGASRSGCSQAGATLTRQLRGSEAGGEAANTARSRPERPALGSQS